MARRSTIRSLLGVAAWLALAFAAWAVPARPLYEPPAAPKAPTVIDLRETIWKGVESADRHIHFHADGTLSYYVTGKGNATWKQDGNIVYFEINKGYREFRGIIVGNVIEGDSWNVAGKRWRTVLQRAPGPQIGVVP